MQLYFFSQEKKMYRVQFFSNNEIVAEFMAVGYCNKSDNREFDIYFENGTNITFYAPAKIGRIEFCKVETE
jgi:hypothetical protein